MKDRAHTVSIVHVDDDPRALRLIAAFLESVGGVVRSFERPRECLASLAAEPADIVITDLNMPGMNGLDVLRTIKARSPSTEVIIATGVADKKNALQALKHGAFDFFEKPIDRDEFLASIERVTAYHVAVRERDRFEKQVSFLSRRESEKWGVQALIGQSATWRKVLEEIDAVQRNDRITVLLLGESGTGKELAARAIHGGSARSDRPFIAVNSSAVPEHLAESMLFGHVKGAFTGATTDRHGSFELADGGTLFLDEIGDMLPAVQVKLLRVLEERVVEPVGSARARPVDIRVVCATNADLSEKVASGSFRKDLFHRLAAFTIRLPPLRERKEDIPLLAQHFAACLFAEMGQAPRELPQEVVAALGSYAYPGNVRELKNRVEQALVRAGDGTITPAHIRASDPEAARPALAPREPAEPRAAQRTDDLPFDLKDLETLAIRRAMAAAGGNVSAAARLLGIGRSRLYRRLNEA